MLGGPYWWLAAKFMGGAAPALASAQQQPAPVDEGNENWGPTSGHPAFTAGRGMTEHEKFRFSHALA